MPFSSSKLSPAISHKLLLPATPQYWSPDSIRGVMEMLEQTFGDQLQIISFDGEWLNFKVEGQTADYTFMLLDSKQSEIFGLNFTKYQVLRPQNPSQDRGVFLREVKDGREAWHGFWLY
ncbi:MAG: hypothetical protein ACRD68_01520 [Pyrinomonadaceae bacterium]